VGLAPGLTNLLAAEVYATSPGPVDIAVLLGAGEKHGAAAIDWTYRLLGRHFPDTQQTGRMVRNYTQPRRFPLPGYGRRSLFLTDFSDQHALTRDLGVPVRTYLGVDSRLVTASLAALTWVPGGSRMPCGLQLPGSARERAECGARQPGPLTRAVLVQAECSSQGRPDR
jgi:saccharopine dehydrogenase-like NADP-dependent oxidoreductase